MIRLRELCEFFLPLMLAPALQAQDKPTSPWAIDRSMSVSPQGFAGAAPEVPPATTQFRVEGGQRGTDLALVHEQNGAARKYWMRRQSRGTGYRDQFR